MSGPQEILTVRKVDEPPPPHPDPRERPLVIDRSGRGRMLVSGPKAAELLNGLLSNDVGVLTPGAGLYACALTPKGKIVADLRLYATADGLLIDIPERAREGWAQMVRKYINPRVAPYRDVSGEMRMLTVFGAGAAELLARTFDMDAGELRGMSRYGHGNLAEGVRVAHAAELQEEMFDLFVSGAAGDVRARLLAKGGGEADDAVWTIARVEAGRPEWGVDIDENTLPQEANMDALGAISYTKGCYVGQEVVARIHFRGHVNRQLRGLRFDHPDGAGEQAELRTADGKAVGDVRTSARSPRFGPIALGMVRREITSGSEVMVAGGVAGVRAVVVDLPFTG